MEEVDLSIHTQYGQICNNSFGRTA